MISRILANCTVSDLDRAQAWYSLVFDIAPHAAPMPGLLEWHFGSSAGVQVWCEPQRAGKSTLVITETDLDAAAARLRDVGVGHDGPEPGGGARIVRLSDPDGNRVVLIGA